MAAAAKKQTNVRTNQKNDVIVKAFKTAAQLEKWLATNHDRSAGIWLRIEKKGSDRKSVTYAEALDAALCNGWIDGQKNPLMKVHGCKS